MYDALLIPTDGSEVAIDAAEHAYSLGERYDATVRVLSVIEERENVSIVGQRGEKMKTLREHGTDATQRIVDAAFSRDIEAVNAVEIGEPDRMILKYASDNNIDLIVMSTHGRSGGRRFLVGSVTERVIRGGDTPVLTVQR